MSFDELQVEVSIPQLEVVWQVGHEFGEWKG